MLLLLVSGHQGQTVHCLSLHGMMLQENSCQFQVVKHIKTSKPGMAAAVIKLKKYEPDEDICPLLTLKEYLKRTQYLRGDEEKLFISYQKPYKAVSRDTISRWANSFGGGGINTNIYTSHTTRAASTTKAYSKNVPLDALMKAAGWKSENTFHRFYNKPVQMDDVNLTEAILS